ncbi:MAG: DinB family protein [Bacteroidales bacterium]|nr:DinB family protein [Bacteroidales bacterium]
MNEFEPVCKELIALVDQWEPNLTVLSEKTVTNRKNSQNRSIKQILGHMCDSASNNTHRTVHLQYQGSPLQFPNYASYGNNDRWIAIQNYQEEDWNNLIGLWKYSNIHIVHVFRNIDNSKLENVWEADTGKYVSLRSGIVDYLRHFKLHLDEIEELIEGK